MIVRLRPLVWLVALAWLGLGSSVLATDFNISAPSALDFPSSQKSDLAISPGQCVEESLASSDDLLGSNQTYFDRYTLEWPGGDLRIVQHSQSIDCVLIVYGPPGFPDGEVSMNHDPTDPFKPEVFFAPSALAGTYTILANSSSPEFGPYTLCVNESECTSVLVSDSFDRPDADRCMLGEMDRAFGGAAANYYVPVWPFGGIETFNPIGADIAGNHLENNGLDFGGVQITSFPSPCENQFLRGKNLGQDFKIHLDLLVPEDLAGNITRGGPYFRSRAAARGDGLFGGQSAGYFVALDSHGIVHILNLNTVQDLAFSAAPNNFIAEATHTLDVSVRGNELRVWLDGLPLTFDQGSQQVTTVVLSETGGFNEGAVGICFTSQDNRGTIGGQRADDFVISVFCPPGPTPTFTPTVPVNTRTHTPTSPPVPTGTVTPTPTISATPQDSPTPTLSLTSTQTATPTSTRTSTQPVPTSTLTRTPGPPTATLRPRAVDRVGGVTSPDLSGDGHVGSEDLQIFSAAWDLPGNRTEDLSLNGRVDRPDLTTLVKAWGTDSPRLDLVSPDHGSDGDTIALSGSGFGPSAEEGSISIGGARVPPSDILAWSDTAASFRITAGLGGGPLAVLRNEVPSNTLPFSKMTTRSDANLSPGGGLLTDGGGLLVEIPAGVVDTQVPFTFGMSDREGSPAYIPLGEEVSAVVYMDRLGENPQGATLTLTIPLSASYPAGTLLDVLRISPLSGHWGAWTGEIAVVQPGGTTAQLKTTRLESFLLRPLQEAPPPGGKSEPDPPAPSKQVDPATLPRLIEVPGFGDTGTPIILVHGNRSEYRPGYSYGQVIEWARNRPGFADHYRLFHFVHDSAKPIGFDLEAPNNSARDLGDIIEQAFPDPDQHVILWAHSRGGLVCRAYMNYYDPPWGEKGDAGKRVAALITFGSPHHGTPGIIGAWFYQTLNNHFDYWGKTFRDPLAPGNQVFTIAMAWNLVEDLHPITDPRHRPGSVGLGWNNFDTPNGIPTDDFYYLISTDDYFFLLDPRDRNTGLEQLSNEDRYKDRMITNGGYFDWNQSVFNEPAHLLGSALPIGDVNKEHIQLAVVSRVLGAFESEGMDPYLPHYLLNDGVVPLQSALYLSQKTPPADELLYPTEESGYLLWKKTVPQTPFSTLDEKIVARVQTAQARWWPQYDHTDMADGHTSNNFAQAVPNTLDDFDLYETAYEDLSRVPVINEIQKTFSGTGLLGDRYLIRGSGFGGATEGKVYLARANDPQGERQQMLGYSWGSHEIEFEVPANYEHGSPDFVFVEPANQPLIPMMEGYPLPGVSSINIDLSAFKPSSNLYPQLNLYVEQPGGSTVWWGSDMTQIGYLVEGGGFNTVLSGYRAPNPGWEGEAESEIVPGTYTVRFHYRSLYDSNTEGPSDLMTDIFWQCRATVNGEEIFEASGSLSMSNPDNYVPGSTGPDWVDLFAFDPFEVIKKSSVKLPAGREDTIDLVPPGNREDTTERVPPTVLPVSLQSSSP